VGGTGRPPDQKARLGLGGPVLRDNRRGLGAEFRIQDSMAEPEPEVALQPVATVEAVALRGAGQNCGGGEGLAP